MALNSDFKVKDSLYVGNSACFVTCTDTPRILSAGTDLWDIFLQEDEITASCTLSNGDGIASLSYDGSADTTIAVDNAVIDGVAEGTAQGQIAVTNIGNTTTQVDVNGLQSGDSPTFGGLALNGALTTTSTVDGVDIATRDAQLAVLQGLSAGNVTGASSPSQGTVRITDQAGNNTDVDTGLQTADSPSFAGVTADNIQIGVTAANEIDTSSGNLTLDSAGGTVIIDDATTLCGAVTLGTGTVAGVSNTVLVSDGGQVKTDFIDSRVWGTTLVDGSGTAQKITMWSDANTVTDSIITQNGSNDAINIAGGVTITDNLSVMGTFTCLDTSVSTTSALSVINTGTGPAIYAEQTGASQPIAKFVDTEGGQMVIGDTGNVGIGGSTDNPSDKLQVTGNACVSGNMTLGTSPSDLLTINGATITLANIQDGTNDGNKVLVTDSSNCVVNDTVDSKIFNTKLVDSTADATTQNNIPKFSNTSGTIGDSAITDSGTLVTIDSDTKIDSNHALQVFATGGAIYSEDKTFTATVGTGGTAVNTFTKSGLNSVKYNVALVNGVNKTAFEIMVVYNGTTAVGTVYGIVDAQTASQLTDIEVSNSGSTIDLTITAASASTTAIIQGKALY